MTSYFGCLSRPFNIGQLGDLWHCNFMGWRSKDQKMLFGSVPFWPVPISAVVRGNYRGEIVVATA